VNIIKKMDHIVYTIFRIVTVAFFIAMVLLVAAQVYTRFFTKNSLTWSEELSRYFMAYMIFLSVVLVAREKGHLCIDHLVAALPPVIAKIVITISLLLQILFFTIVIWGAFKLYPTAAVRVSPANAIPMPLVYFCVPLACGMMILYCIRDLAELYLAKEVVK